MIREKSCGSLRLLGEAEAGSAGKQPRQGIAESKRRSDVGTDLVLFQFQIRLSFAWFLRRLRRAVRAKGTLHLTAPFFSDSIAIVRQLPGSISPFVDRSPLKLSFECGETSLPWFALKWDVAAIRTWRTWQIIGR